VLLKINSPRLDPSLIRSATLRRDRIHQVANAAAPAMLAITPYCALDMWVSLQQFESART